MFVADRFSKKKKKKPDVSNGGSGKSSDRGRDRIGFGAIGRSGSIRREGSDGVADRRGVRRNPDWPTGACRRIWGSRTFLNRGEAGLESVRVSFLRSPLCRPRRCVEGSWCGGRFPGDRLAIGCSREVFRCRRLRRKVDRVSRGCDGVRSGLGIDL